MKHKICIEEYISKGNPCPCHPAESTIAVEALKTVMQEAVTKAVKTLAREYVDDEIVLSEEIIS